jgi:hypothetical protein
MRIRLAGFVDRHTGVLSLEIRDINVEEGGQHRLWVFGDGEDLKGISPQKSFDPLVV